MSPNIAPARLAALKILRKVELEQGNSDTLLHSPQVDGLSAPDRNLCTAIVFGTLRWQRVLDAQYRRFLVRPDTDIPLDAQLALRVGAYQLLFLDRIPAHAAIFESVEWIKQSTAASHTGLANAVLRKLAGLPKPQVMDAIEAYPEWMVKRWRSYYGQEACRQICERGQQEQPAAIRLAGSAIGADLEPSGIDLQPGALLKNARFLNPDSSRGTVPANHYHFQDEGSQLVAELLGRGERILDCCAAPGGKTLVLKQNNPDARLLACDLDAGRLAPMRRRLADRLNASHIEFRVADAAKLTGLDPFDRILCDVPCSGTGTLGRNPEIRHRLQPEDIARQATRQHAILSNAIRLVAPGGRLLYSTCSLEPEENESVVEACLQEASAKKQGIRRLDLASEFDHLELTGVVDGKAVSTLRATGFTDGYLQTVPGVHRCDGFFAALIERA